MSTAFSKDELKTEGKVYETSDPFYTQIEILNSPITPRENLQRFYRGEDYEWIPDTYSDIVEVASEINPDCIASGYEGGYDSFGVYWEPQDTGLPAIVRPGNPVLTDLADWRSLKIADPDEWDWKGDAEQYKIFDPARILRANLQTALFERLIDVLEFEEAAMALLSQPEDVEEFLTAVTDFNLKVMKHYIEDFGLDCFMIGDDWSSQRAPFFSTGTARELLLPHMKAMAGYAHEHGCTVAIHSCGNGSAFIPLWIEAGFDAWQFQESAVNIEEAMQLAGDQIKLEGYWVIPDGLDEQGVNRFIEETMRKYCSTGQVSAAFCDKDYIVSPEVRRKTYEIGRILRNEMK